MTGVKRSVRLLSGATSTISPSPSATGVKPLRTASSLLVCAPIRKPSDGGADFKVLMVKRQARGSFGSMHAYPGGVVDSCDSDAKWEQLTGRTLANQRIPPDTLPLRLAALRETFEETGLFLTHPPLPLPPQTSTHWRHLIHTSGHEFHTLCTSLSAAPRVNALVLWANWITPVAQKARFDTFFYLTVLDSAEGHDVSADGTECTEARWWTPREALEAYQRGEISLIVPQYLTLLELSHLHLSDLRSYISGETRRTAQQLAPICPEPLSSADGLLTMAMPGDWEYPGCSSEGSDGKPLNRVKIRVEGGRFVEIRHVCNGGERGSKL
ncbi:uncharacterized protein EV422DRAFT_290559 [Fimicolochytrium jonesii]|uniref:uncharacterized protein n=1 Tax=Fimicolochytrium jonesii TaxID=1396493 RepID=UPI0022FF2158|nr:uncharacterized protein EV422DRAFT_290559 [Fimicolochytrium jonesii]KAI8816385.1 hypothetical protein EV422DRAFT_290559 [Fimicolochytrium jonesii]